MIVGNPDATYNRRNGAKAFAAGKRDKESVLRAHLTWNRGTSADYHFCWGYRDAAIKAGETVGEALDYLPIWDGSLPIADQVRILEIKTEVNPGYQWALDRARASLARPSGTGGR